MRVTERLSDRLSQRRNRVPFGDGVRRNVGRLSLGTKVLAMNVIGKMTMNEALLIAFGDVPRPQLVRILGDQLRAPARVALVGRLKV